MQCHVRALHCTALHCSQIQIRKLEEDRLAREAQIHQLNGQLRQAKADQAALQQVQIERDSLRNETEEQRRLLADYQRQIEALKQRCYVLENEQKEKRAQAASSASSASGRVSPFPSWGSHDPHQRQRQAEPMSGPSTAADSFAISYTLADGLEDPLRSERSRTTLCRFFFCCTRRSRQALFNRITQSCAIQ